MFFLSFKLNCIISQFKMAQKEFFLIVAVAMLASNCRTSNKQEQKEEPIPVVTTRAAKVSSDTEISLSGNIEGKRTVRLGFLVAGKIESISAEEGQAVSEGQMLSSLDPASYSIAKEIADAKVSQVQDEYDRLKIMHDRNSLSESDFTKISLGLQQAKAEQKLHAKNLADTKLYVPFNGVLLKRLAEVGEITGTGIPLFVVADIRTVKVTAFIPENELHCIKLGQVAKVTVSSLSDTFTGKVTEVGSAADPASRAFTVKIDVENPGLLIRPGMIAEVKITAGKQEAALVVPMEAVQHDPANLSYVFVVDSARQKAFRRNVSLGKIINSQVEITSGLAENEIVVTGGQQKLVDGGRIQY
jgi:RND family efflux transporter MFP subunit